MRNHGRLFQQNQPKAVSGGRSTQAPFSIVAFSTTGRCLAHPNTVVSVDMESLILAFLLMVWTMNSIPFCHRMMWLDMGL